ncbi:conserved hypothetical protein [Aeromonas phage 65]|uniref:Ryanodine receptor Ryr domain-containing protein n=2 Tax=Ishigurovirus osborne TaxID=260149 RepID=A0A219YBT4_9CAUD|nr:hypothetical protein ST65p078 [Aeromonas phage 65]ADQ53088.1 conserved hypothetical protein [Aeromonas phage 65]APU01466.1 hypothetical protein [Aeromonas phage 65.2]
MVLGDTDTLWKDEPEKVKRVWTKHVNYIIDHPDSDSQTVHNLWRTYKNGQGWIFGEEKSTEDKTHPCLVPYEKLHEIEHMKYFIFMETVREQQ